MRWRKLGLIFCADNHAPWMKTHAANPVAEPLGNEAVRIYFSCRDAMNRSSIGWLEIDTRRPTVVTRLCGDAVVAPGPLGAFDDSGASMGCIVADGNQRRIYYMGWNLAVTVPWRNSIGMAVADRGSDRFNRWSQAPIVDRGPTDPFSISYPWVLREDGNWRMWYGSNLAWGTNQSSMAHVIKYADSSDGVSWRREGRIAVNLQSEGEYAISKPCVIKDGRRYLMWYAHRGAAYRIGYAESVDGLEWDRKDAEAGIEPSAQGWDSNAICYPCVFDCGKERYMLYNGDRYGATGFGIAILDGE